MAPIGFAVPFPAMSGAEPCTGSYKNGRPSPILADGKSPSEPATAPASSLRMSPNMFSVTITSNCAGARTSCMAQVSTSRCSRVTSGNSRATTSTVSRQSREVSSTLALSTEVTFRRRPRAIEQATRATRAISSAE